MNKPTKATNVSIEAETATVTAPTARTQSGRFISAKALQVLADKPIRKATTEELVATENYSQLIKRLELLVVGIFLFVAVIAVCMVLFVLRQMFDVL